MSETQVEAERQTDEKTQKKLGSLLKSYREKNGHDVYEVAEALCLSPEIVRSLEEENFDALPEPPYIRGYLRSYAKFSGIDSKKIIELYEAQRGADPQDLEYHFKPNNNDLAKPPVSAATLRLGLIALLLIVLAGLSMIPAVNNWIGETWAGFSKQTAQKNYNNAANHESILAANRIEKPIPLPGEKTEEEDKTANDTANSSAEGKTAQDKNAIADKKGEDADKEKDKTEANNEQEADKTAEDSKNNSNEEKDGTKLKFVFKKDVWMRIRDKNKKIVFEALSLAGDEKEIRVHSPMTFRIGNAQGIEIYVEGKRLDITSFIKGSVANFTIE